LQIEALVNKRWQAIAAALNLVASMGVKPQFMDEV
jgi:hypothetical protein